MFQLDKKMILIDIYIAGVLYLQSHFYIINSTVINHMTDMRV